jgi:hypothetical protein
VDRLTQRVPGVLSVLFGPEESEEGIAPVRTAGSGECQVDEKRGPLGLREDRAQLLTLGTPEVQSAQHPEVDHLGSWKEHPAALRQR